MPPLDIETRVAILEAEVERLRSRVEAGGTPPPPPSPPWWERIDGTFADDPVYEQAMMLGRAYRESLRPGKPKVRKR
jgi:hypothetical protein